MTQRIWFIFMRAVENLKICALMIGSFCPCKDLEKVQGSYASWLKSDARFEEKLTLGSKNDMRSLVNLDESSDKSENLHIDALLFLVTYKVSARKEQKDDLSWHWKRSKLTFYLKNDLRNLLNFNLSSWKFKNLHLGGLLL